MITEQHLILCQRIIGYCRRRQWYGPDDATLYRGYVDKQGKLQRHAVTHNRHVSFEFPPATEKQIQDTERSLGFALPPMLRALYMRVANGGFGPACGITGASGGYYCGEDGHYQTIGMEPLPETFTGPLLEEECISLGEYERQHGDPLMIELPSNTWPDRFLQICYTGCGMDVYLDAASGHVYRVESGVDDETEDLIHSLYRLDDSFEQWLENWLAGNPDL